MPGIYIVHVTILPWQPTRDSADHYATVNRREWQAAHERITQREMDHKLQLYESGVGPP